MSETTKVVPGSAPAGDELRLPKPPGVIRAFWARHPRLADWLIAAVSLILTIPGAILASVLQPLSGFLTAVAIVLTLVTSAALLWRRRHPITVFCITFAPVVFVEPDLSSLIVGVSSLFAIYSVAVYRSNRAAMWLLAGAVIACTIVSFTWMLTGYHALGDAISMIVAGLVLLLIGALIGVNVGSRKRYVEALIERSKQLAEERDRKAKLAAVEERTRIAREMHDIVSHSLAVVVTLAEGAHATDSLDRARQANRAIADTARASLDQMRIMLGVLRDDGTDEPPLAPTLDTSPDELVETARAAGVPVTLTVSGTPHDGDMQRLAVRRIVQESLTNAMRYAPNATAVSVTIAYSSDTATVEVVNDGVHETRDSQGSGLGLQGLAERVAAVDGTFSAGPLDNNTWRVRATVPKEQHSA